MDQLGDLASDDLASSGTPAPATPPERPDRVIGGVAGTIAARLRVDALWVRLGFVVLGLAGGIGVLVYAAWWLVLVGGLTSRPMRIVGGALLVVAVPWLIADGPQSFVTGPFAVVLLLAGLALALWQPRREQEAPRPAAPAFPPPEPQVSPPGDVEVGGVDGPWHVLADAMRPPAADAPARRFGWRRSPPERSLLGRITLCIALYVAAAWALADQLDGGRLHPEQWFGAAAVICGAGLVVGMFRGRARWLIVPAVLAAGAGYVGGTMARLGITGGDLAGDRYVTVGSYTSVQELDERAGLGEVQITIDSPPPQPVHVDARVGLGQIHLNVASDVTVELRPRLDHGSVRSNRGSAVSETAPTLIGDGTTADVVVDAWVGLGDIEIIVFEVPPPMPGDPSLVPVPSPPGPLVPEEAGALVNIGDGIAMTTDGWVVLGDGEAVISPDDEITIGSTYPEPDGSQTIDTGWGTFRLLPRSLLLTPYGQVLDLQVLRADVSAATDTSTVPVSTIPGG
jgi:phage shock protein PspC (stress-responsive transcriptional regulator)